MSVFDGTIAAETMTQVKLGKFVAEASRALAHLDADSLEAMAHYCEELIEDDWARIAAETRRAPEAGEASKEMAVFGRVMDATRANLNVMRRLHEMHIARMGHCEGISPGGDHGDY